MRFRTVPGRALARAATIVSFGIFSARAGAQTEAAPHVERKTLEEAIAFLASDELAGRGNGSPGLEEAGRFISSRFRELGLRPAGDGDGYYQRFRVRTGQEIGHHTLAVLYTPAGRRTLEYGTDFEPLTFSAAAEVEAPLVFAGYGVTAPEHDYDDYGSVDADGKLVLLLRYAPAVFGKHGWHATFVRKAENAASHGARGILVVNGPLDQRDDKLVPFGVDMGSEAVSIAAVHFRREPVEALLRGSGRDLLELQRSIESDLTPRSFEVRGVRVSLTVDLHRKAVEVENVIGFLPSTREKARAPLADVGEYVVIGAHYDHLGRGERGSRDREARGVVHNGADDNASGVAGLLELARIFSRVENRPRGLLFIAFAGEELGLRGSYYYTSHPTLPLRNAIAMINLDMIGRLRHDRLYIGGLDLEPQLETVVRSFLEAERLSYSTRFMDEGGSDHTPFLRAGVPALLFFTGLHGDYHKPTDDAQFINVDGMERVLHIGFELSDYLIRTGDRPALSTALGTTVPDPSRGGEEAAYFGVGVDTSFEGEGVRFAYVASDGPAARAGLRAGDVLIEIDGRSVRSSERAAVIIRERRPGEMVTAKVLRKDQILDVKIRLASWP